MTIWEHLVKLTGDIYLTYKPMFLMYHPTLHLLKGDEIRQIINTVLPGDILLRRYNGYLNTILTGGYYGHAGLYIGGNKVIHAVSRGVIEEDLLDFCRTDGICILSTNKNTECAIAKAKRLIGKPYDYSFSSKNKKYYCTELINVCYDGLFDKNRIKTFGKNVLLPDAIFNSKEIKFKIEFRH